MYVVIHKQIDAIEKILPKWERLRKEFHAATVFQDIGWIKSGWEYNSWKSKVSPYIVEIKKGNKTIGVIPLYCVHKEFANLRFRILKPIGSELLDYLIPILSKEYPPEKQLEKALEKIYEDRENWDYIEWSDIPENSLSDSILRKNILKSNAWIKRERTDICPYLTLNQDIEELILKFDQKLVKEIVKKERKLTKKGDLIYCRVLKEDEIEYIMNKFYELHCERWKGTDTPSEFRYKEERDRCMRVARSLFRSNLLHLCYLKHNNEIIAVEFAMSDKEKVYLYLTAFNKEFRKYSVGNILLYNLILDACRQGYEIVDFTRGDEGYKQQWGTVDKYNVKYHFFNGTIKSTFYKIINNTYYSKQFVHKPIAMQLFIKAGIRGSVLLLRIVDKLNFTKTAKVTNPMG